jgi:hypothetical protein
MDKRCILAFILIPLLAQASSDAVNERLPVNAAEKEQHWHIDCTASWKQLQSQACAATPGLQRHIQLCSMIYQPPGEPPQHQCPDYQQAYQHLKLNHCEALRLLLVEQAACHQNKHFNPRTIPSP